MDKYTADNLIALEVLDSNGKSQFNGVSRRTIRAFARRGLVWDEGDGTAILTDAGRAVLAEAVPA